MKIISIKNRFVDSLAYPLIFISVISAGCYVIRILPLLLAEADSFNVAISLAWSVLCGGFVTYSATKNTRKALSVSASLLICNYIYFAVCGSCLSIAAVLALSAAFAFLSNRYSLLTSYIVCTLSGFLLAIVLAILYDNMYQLLKSLCALVSGKPILFGIVSNVTDVLLGNGFSDMFYHKDYSASLVIHNSLVSGAVDIFLADRKSPSAVTSEYLTGQYFVNIFLTLGIFASLYSKFRDEMKTAFISVILLSVVTGNSVFLSVLLLLCNPFIYLGYLFVIFISYLTARFLDIRIGFEHTASLVELVLYGRQWLWMLLVGVIISVLMYVVSQLILAKFDIDKRRYFPRNVRRLVAALGGERNIQELKNGRLIVSNPNLINILEVDCDIHENEVTLIDTDYELLLDFF